MHDIDIAAVRADTPAVATLTHLNNAGASLSPTPVLEATIDYLRAEAALGGYAIADARASDLNAVYTEGATLLGCKHSELAFMGGASEGWWRAFTGVPLAAGDVILTGRSEFVSNAIGMIQAKERGIDVVVVGNDEHGQLDLAEFANRLDDRVKLVCLTHVPMTSGLVNPVAQVGAMVRETDAYFLLDACQAVGQLRVDVDEIGCDMLSFTGRKWVRGPRGTGLMYVRESVMDQLAPPTFIDGRSADWIAPLAYQLHPTAQRYEFGEYGYAAKVGLGVAIAYANRIGIEAIAARIAELSNALRAALHSLDNVTVYDPGVNKCGIVTFTVAGHDPAAVVAALRTQNINTAAPGARTSMLDIGAHGLASIVRASVHYYNTQEELDRLVSAVAAM